MESLSVNIFYLASARKCQCHGDPLLIPAEDKSEVFVDCRQIGYLQQRIKTPSIHQVSAQKVVSCDVIKLNFTLEYPHGNVNSQTNHLESLMIYIYWGRYDNISEFIAAILHFA